eukprot:6199254-Pleurochrysis_carterae.AAC.2
MGRRTGLARGCERAGTFSEMDRAMAPVGSRSPCSGVHRGGTEARTQGEDTQAGRQRAGGGNVAQRSGS